MNSRTITFEMLTAGQRLPTLVLRAPASLPAANPVSSVSQKVDGIKKDAKRRMEDIEQKLLAKVKNEDMSAEEAKRLIQENMEGLKGDLSQTVDDLQQALTEKLEEMTPEQRKTTVYISRETRGFFQDLCNFVKTVTKKLVDLIVEGYKLVKKVVKDIYETVKQKLAEAWDEFLSLF